MDCSQLKTLTAIVQSRTRYNAKILCHKERHRSSYNINNAFFLFFASGQVHYWNQESVGCEWPFPPITTRHNSIDLTDILHEPDGTCVNKKGDSRACTLVDRSAYINMHKLIVVPFCCGQWRSSVERCNNKMDELDPSMKHEKWGKTGGNTGSLGYILVKRKVMICKYN